MSNFVNDTNMSGITYVLLIGVEHYHESANFPQVTYATRDVEGLKETFVRLGYSEDNFTILLNNKATKSAILQRLKKVSDQALEKDRILFYFAGHGFYDSSKNLLAPVDAIKTDKIDTCISIDDILEICKSSACRRSILFFDCCHSGFQAGKLVRDGEDNFMADELIYQFRNEEYCVGFASCKSNQKSMSMPRLQHGAWSYFLIKALSGEAGKIYKNGILFSDDLQSYLNKETSQYVKMNTVDKLEQIPIKFGSETDKFIVADINPIFEENLRIRTASDFSVERVSFFSGTYGLINTLPGFIKGSHTVPKFINSTTKNFVQDKGHSLIEDDINQIAVGLREKLKYKRRDIRSSVDKGVGSIETKDFDYSITIEQEGNNPDQFVVIRRMESIDNTILVYDPEFNSIFSRHFDNLVFELGREVDITSLIDTIEELEGNNNISISYDPSSMDKCVIKLSGAEDYTIEVLPDLVCITNGYKTSPQSLIAVFKQTKQAIISIPELRLIGL